MVTYSAYFNKRLHSRSKDFLSFTENTSSSSYSLEVPRTTVFIPKILRVVALGPRWNFSASLFSLDSIRFPMKLYARPIVRPVPGRLSAVAFVLTVETLNVDSDGPTGIALILTCVSNHKVAASKYCL